MTFSADRTIMSDIDNHPIILSEFLTVLGTSNSISNDANVNKHIGNDTELYDDEKENCEVFHTPSAKSCSDAGVFQFPPTRLHERRDSTRESVASDLSRSSCSSIVDGLLFEIYDRWNYGPRRYSFDSDATPTDYYSSTSDAFFGRSDSVTSACDEKQSSQYRRQYLQNKDATELRRICSELRHRVNQKSTRLIRQLKYRDRNLLKCNRNCDIITAILQASSQKRRIDSKIRFSIEPQPGDEAYNQWRDAMKAVARLSLGIPAEFRKKVWLALADNHINNLKIDWQHTQRLAFNDRSNPDDNRLGLQIVKDLHRTGCGSFSGTDNEEDRAVLKRVLLAYARWNKRVGYCQGFNVLAALILEVMDKKENDALKVMIFLVDHVLPESYFADNLRALSVDMAVFRDLLRIHLPKLSKHLDQLQAAARDDTTGANYEPPLTNVFTMQWFLTLFATCLSKSTALRVWDSIMLEGSEILLRTAVAIWGKLQKRILKVDSADEFYTIMGDLTHQMLSGSLIEPDALMKTVYSMAPLPMPQLSELREKYTYNITPFTAAMATGQRPMRSEFFGDDEDFDEDEFVENINCFGGMFPPQSPSRKTLEKDRSPYGSSFDISKASPGAYAAQPEIIGPLTSMYAERMSLDITQLKNQYKRLRHRQKQAHIILAAASKLHYGRTSASSKATERSIQQAVVAPIQSPVAVNHLFIGRQQLGSCKRNKTVAEAPSIAPFYPNGNTIPLHTQPPTKNISPVIEKPCDVTLDDSDDSDFADDSSQVLSVSSAVSCTSTLKSSDNASEIGTIDPEKDEESIAKRTEDEARAQLNEMILCDTELDYVLPQGNIPVICVDSGSGDNKISSSTEVKVVITDGEATETDSNSANLDSPVKANRPQSLLSLKGNNLDSNKSLSSIGGMISPITTDLSEIKEAQVGISATSHTTASRISSNSNAHYVTSLTYKTQKANHSSNGSLSGNTSPLLSSSGGSSPTNNPGPVRSPKLFNPFPGQHKNSRRMENGVRLGLYSAKNIPKLETGIALPSAGQDMGRAQMNAYIHRQYMQEVKQKGKSPKS